MNEIRTGPYNIEVADPSFCGELGEGSETYVFDSYAEVIAFRVGLEGSGGEYKIVVRHKDGLWSYEDDEDFDCDECGELTEEVYTGKDGGFYCEHCINKIGYEGED